MKKFLSAVLVAAMSLSLLVGCGGSKESTNAEADTQATAESDFAYVQDKGVLTVGMTLFEPMSYYDKDNKFVGFDTELAEATFEKMGVPVEFVEINWDSKEVELEAKNIDCVWNGLCITEERKQNMGITDPYLLNTFAMVMKADKADEIMAGKMSDYTIVSEQGSTCEAVVLGTIDGDADAEVSGAEYFAGANYIAVDSQAKALMEVKAGTADIAVIDTVAAAAMTGAGTDYEDLTFNVDNKFVEQYFGVAFRKDSDLVDKANEIINELYEDGTVAELAAKYNLTDLLMK